MTTLIVDGPYLSHRSYLAPYKLTTKDGRDSTLIHTFLTSFLSFKKTYDLIYIAWESYGTPSWRRELLPTYKPEKPPIQEYIDQMKHLQTILNGLKVPQYWMPKNEADDVIACLSATIKEPHDIFTVDKDIMQLIDDRKGIRVLDNKRKIITEKEIFEKFEVSPRQLPDFLALVGDSSDNIKGIPLIGPKKASKLLKTHKILENVPLDRELRKLVTLNHQLTKLNTSGIPVQLQTENTPVSELLDLYELRKLKEQLKV